MGLSQIFVHYFLSEESNALCDYVHIDLERNKKKKTELFFSQFLLMLH